MLRRDALRFFGQGAAGLSLAPLAASFNAAQAATTDTEDFKALVCIFLFGGNDHANTVIPTGSAAYQAYARARPELALALNTLAPLTGTSLGLHPALVDVQALFNQGKAAMVANVGTLVQPVSKAEWNKGFATVPVPKQLFSHSDQATVWQTAAPTSSVKTGWLGRVSDSIGAQFNAGNATPFVFSAGAPNILTVGNTTDPFQVSAAGAAEAAMPTFLFGATRAQAATNEILGAGGNHPMMRHWSKVGMRALGTSKTINTALNAVSLSTVFPSTPIGQQLNVIAKLIAARRQLGHKRQVYFASMVGFDQHDYLLYNHNKNLVMLNDAIKAFYASTVALGISDKVTSFTASDFGRALQSNGKGSDHGWGSHHFVIGGGVKGGTIYGKFPTVDLGTAEDAGQGRLIPTTGMDQYAATLGKWLGADATALNSALPNLQNFATSDLGFFA
jgi:uncharacterized protein (DUF1501 family)